MTPGLLCLALALLVWPGPGPGPGPGLGLGGRRWKPASWSFRRAGPPFLAGCATAGVVAVLSTVLVGCLAGLCTGLAVRARLAARREARVGQALLALAELLGALTAELRSGRPVDGAIGTALAACGDEVCRRAVGPVLRGAARGGILPGPVPAGPLGEATQRVAAALRLSSRTGCSLAAVLVAVEDDLRARHRHAVDARTATAGPRASAALLAGLPALALAMGGGIGADPWRLLTTTTAGQALLVTGVALEVAGVVWSGRLVRRALR